MCSVYCLSEIFTAGFHFSFGVAFFKSRKIPALETGFTDNRSQHSSFFRNNPGQTWDLFFFLFSVSVVFVFHCEEAKCNKKTPSILIVLPSGASPPFP